MDDRYHKHKDKTFKEAVHRYWDEFEGKAKKRQKYALTPCLLYIGDLPCGDVDEETLRYFKKDRHSGLGHFTKPVMVGTVNKELTSITTVLNRACRDWRWIPSVPRIRHIKGNTRQPYPLTWNEQDRFIHCLPTGWDQGVALFAVNTGVRKAELFGLTWKAEMEIPEINSKVFILNPETTKNGKARAVILNSVALNVVEHNRKLYGNNELVFPSPNGNVVQSVSRSWNKAWIKAGLPDDPLIKKGIHNFRHTYGQRLRASGVPEEDRDALLGHANKSLSQHYAQADVERLTAYSERVTVRTDSVILRPVRTTE